MKRPSDETLQQVVDAYRQHKFNRAAAASFLGISPSTFFSRLRLAESRGIDLPNDPEQSADGFDIGIERLTQELKRAKGELKSIKREVLNATIVREAIIGLAATTPSPPKWIDAPLKTKEKHHSVPSTLWSDWHAGEVVRPEEVNGVNRFDMDVMNARVVKLVNKTIELCFDHMTNPQYPGLVLNLGGDMVSGDIHDELMKTNEKPLLPVVLDVVEIIAGAITRLLDAFDRIYVPCAPGNHGRTTKKIEAKRYVYQNFDWLIYCLLERHFKDDTRIQFDIPESGEVYYQVLGHRYLLVHGNDIGARGGDGIIGAIGPIMRGETKVGRSESAIGREYDTVLMGHWHQMLWLPRAIVNNSLKGYDEFAYKFLRATSSLPSQALWFTHPVHGITARWEILLEEKPNRGVSWCSVLDS
jgi:hypothetical protein